MLHSSRSRCVSPQVGFVTDVNGIGGADAAGAGSKLVELLRAIRTVMTSNRPRPTDPHASRMLTAHPHPRSVPLIFLNLLCMLFLFLLG
jgi:hypothetical protein